MLMCFDGIFVREDSFQYKLLQILRKQMLKFRFGVRTYCMTRSEFNALCSVRVFSFFVTAFLNLVDDIFVDLSIYRRCRVVTVFSEVTV